MAALKDYLKTLNSSDSQWGVWVNPENPTEDYRIGQFIFDNGGLDDGWVRAGSLENLSFGFQFERDAFASWISGGQSEHISTLTRTISFNDRDVHVNPEALYEAYTEGKLDKAFAGFIENELQDITAEWADLAAEDFVENRLPEILESALAEVY